jgi:Na+/proline symporter
MNHYLSFQLPLAPIQTSAFLLLLKLSSTSASSPGNCIENVALNQEFARIITNGASSTYEIPDKSCCQFEICGLPCPEDVSKPAAGFGIAVMIAIIVFVLIGFSTMYFVKSKAENYFVAGRSLPLWVVSATLASQSLDSNALLGNADLSYKYHFYDGAVLPIGLGLSLILNGVFLAAKINKDNALTLPDVFAKRYGKLVELLVSFCTIISFLCLLAGNLVGMGTIISYIVDISQGAAIAISAILVLLYTIAGGLFSVAYTDVIQSVIGWIGCCTFAFYMIRNAKDSAPPSSIGFPGYSYPDDATCAMYEGVPCTNLEGACCYNEAKWCPSNDNCVTDNGAYPVGDRPVIPAAMTNPTGLTPFPNAILWNWSTIFILGFGNLAALDFQARCMASKTPKIATIACLIAGCLTFFVGIPFSYLGAITRTHYGPDSTRAEFKTDTCSSILDLPTCGMWVPDATAFIKLLTHEAPSFLGGWCLIGIVAASMSTCDGAILAMGTVFSHNIVRNLNYFVPSMRDNIITKQNLLMLARCASVPLTAIATLIAVYYRSSHSAGATGYLLIVAFDVVFATCVVPLFGCFYTKKPSPLAALLSIISGAIVRVILEFALPKDGFLLAPFDGDEFLDYGKAASSAVPGFIDAVEADRWNQTTDPCKQSRFNDLTGVDSLSAPFVSLIVFVIVQFLERNKPLFIFKEEGIMCPYEKNVESDKDKDQDQDNPVKTEIFES